MCNPAVPELVLIQIMMGGSRTRGDSGGGHFDVTSEKGDLYLGAPNFAHTINVCKNIQIRKLAFPTAQWEGVLDEAADGGYSLESLQVYRGPFRSQAIQATLRNLWALSDEEGAPSRLLARAAGCEILAELCRLSGASLAPARGGLAPWAKRRCLELMQERLAEDISLDELAAEARLSPFHFARMFKESVGVPPRAYLTRLRLERACQLLETTDLPVTEIALEVGYSSNQVLARLFVKHRNTTPSDYRRAVRDQVLSSR
ncbi:helix-turn-helix transcriptional regulator [Salinarimonas soli]|uniref:Helix-turn-helix transcriptional regulator n=2 Tax=Salinarimonas soli TaxID=1638099 RepID=A0A5B2W097_9HYPH|nr:helix-turn-helix transcriptional regulator [Salinarimonas soli]